MISVDQFEPMSTPKRPEYWEHCAHVLLKILLRSPLQLVNADITKANGP